MPLKRACGVVGWGRSRMYEIIDAGLVRAVKAGPKSTLVDVGSLLGYMATLPAATSAAEAKAAARALRAKRRSRNSPRAKRRSGESIAPPQASPSESEA
jgi:pyruvate/2-oxoglutarate dehydrogenase complex dihydrolipoamide acyltransferase (E2) component